MTKPNIVFFLADDLGPWALGCAGNDDMITPNIDRLAEEGMMFDSFFCASPVCSPARASLLTGKIPSQHGVHDWLHDAPTQEEEIEYLEGQIAYTDVLAQAGYRCGLSGKWHVGRSQKVQKSFDHFFAHQSGSGPYYNAPFFRNGVFEVASGYVTDVIADDAIAFIEASHEMDTPFYLNVGFTAPHSPWTNNHPKEYTDLYASCMFDSLPKDARHHDAIYLTDMVEEDLHANQVGYFAATTAMDANIGRIIDKLESLGILDNTIIIFSSDNGFSCGHHGFWGKGNGTYPINLYDESVKVPFIVRDPRKVKPGVRSGAMVSAYDFFPTIIDYLGLQFEFDSTYPGRSFAGVLTQEVCEDEFDRVYIFDEYGPNRMIRSKDQKYIKRYPFGPDAWYNLKNDPHEYDNLVEEYDSLDQSIPNALRRDLDAWFNTYVNPEIDGAREAVYGSGQIHKAGMWSEGKPSHANADFVMRDEHYKK